MLGLAVDQWEICLPLGILFELFWLDVLPLGSVVPPYGTLSFLLLFPLALLYGWRQPDTLLLPIVFSMLCASVASRLEQCQRELPCDTHSTRAILCGVLIRAGAQYGLYMLCFLMLTALGPLLARTGAQWFPSASWAVFYAAALTGSVLGLRIRGTYVILLASLIIVGFFMTL